MPDYLVEWRINITANTREEAARIANEVFLDPGNIATVFHVTDEKGEETTVDVGEGGS